MNITWKDIIFTDFDGIVYDYTGLYKINNIGDVYSYKSKKVLSKSPDKDGYPRAGLCKNGSLKTFKVHRLVAFMFLDKPLDEDATFVNHLDENKANNDSTNLEWCTMSHNNNHGTRQARVHKKRRKTMATSEWKINNSGVNHPHSKQIVSINIEDGSVEYYETLTQASRSNDLSVGWVSSIIRKKRIAKNCVWFSLDEYEEFTAKNGKDKIDKIIETAKEKFIKNKKAIHTKPSTTTESIA